MATDYSKVAIGIDPGKMTGWARWVDGSFTSGQDDLWTIMRWVDEILRTGLRPLLVCEDFIITAATAQKSRQTDPLDGIGAMKWFAHYYEVDLLMQQPRDAKRFSTDDKLIALDWFNPTKGGHANDAARHLMLALTKRKMISHTLTAGGEIGTR